MKDNLEADVTMSAYDQCVMSQEGSASQVRSKGENVDTQNGLRYHANIHRRTRSEAVPVSQWNGHSHQE